MKLSSREFPHLVQNRKISVRKIYGVVYNSGKQALTRISDFFFFFFFGGGEVNWVQGLLGVPILFHPIALHTHIMNIRVSKISNGVSKRHPDTPLAKGLVGKVMMIMIQ